MAQAVKDSRIILSEDEIIPKLLEGAEASYKAVTTTFGPRGKNYLIEKPFGRPLLTRDGVTVARDVYFKDRAKNMGAQLILEASETTNRVAGDGTTATVALGYRLLKRGVQALAAGVHPMELKAQLLGDSYTLLDELDKLAQPTKAGQLQDVATVSSGDPLLGQLISEAIEYVGVDGGILVEKYPTDSVEREYVDGYYLQSGFQALQVGKKELVDPWVVVLGRRVSSAMDIAEIMNNVAKLKQMEPGQVARFLFIGNIDEAAYNLVVENVNAGRMDAVILKTPASFGDMGKQLLEDIAIYAGCDPITDSMKLREINLRHVGSVNKMVATKSESTLFADSETESIQVRVAEIKDQLDTELAAPVKERLKDRIAKLEGKIALFRIGGATDTSREETEARVEDAIQATRAAAAHGVVPGGGVTLLQLSSMKISPLYRDALRDVFKQLLVNANLPAELKLDEALKAPDGYGFNLREGDNLVDVVAAGVLDPKLVVEQIIKNATDVAANGLTIGGSSIFEDSKEDK